MAAGLKVRIMLMAGGSVIGLAGAAAFTWAATAALVPYLGIAGAAGVVGGTLTIGAAFAMWKATRPGVPMEDEFAGVTAAAANTITYIRDDTIDTLTGMSLNTLNRVVEKQPLLTLAGVAVAAYTVARMPNTMGNVVDRVLSRLT